MSFKRIFYCLFLSTIGLSAYSQTDEDASILIEYIIEDLAQNSDDESDLDYSDVVENLTYFFNNPLNINLATENDLDKIPILNSFQIRALIEHRKKFGDFYTIYELQMVDGFSENLIKSILPFIKVDKTEKTESLKLSKALSYGRHSIISRASATVEKPTGYSLTDGTGYKGNRIQWMNKYQFNYAQKLLFGLTTEKDAGEQFFKGNQQKGFDFYAGYLQLKDLGIIKNFVLGDYQMQFGQGLIMWSYIGSRKTPQVLATRKRQQGIRKYTSTDENSFLRGTAITVGLKNFVFTVFGSKKKFDANVKYDSIVNKAAFTSFQLSGIHSTDRQIEQKDAVAETTFGGNINWKKNNFSCGVSAVDYKYSIPLQPNQSVTNKFAFNGTENYNISSDVNFHFRSLHLFGEGAFCKNGGKAIIAGALLKLNSQFNATVLYRNFEKNFQTHFGNAFKEGTKTQNENGFYLGAELFPYPKWKISAYYDFFNFPWLKSGVNTPSVGNDFFAQADYNTSRKVQMYWRIKHEQKQSTFKDLEYLLPPLQNKDNTSVRYQIDYKVAHNLTLRNRFEVKYINNPSFGNSYGYLLYQDAIYTFNKTPLSIKARYALFDTENYDTRIYAYEADVYQAFSVPAYYDKGSRVYILFKYTPLKNITLWLKISQTYFAHKNPISSGLNQINNNKRTDIRLQLRYKF